MSSKSFLVVGSILVVGMAAYFLSSNVNAASHTVSISNSAFSVLDLSIPTGDIVKWDNNDDFPQKVTVLRATDSAVIVDKTLAKSSSSSATTVSKTFNSGLVGEYYYRLNDSTENQGHITVFASSSTPTNTATPTVTPAPTTSEVPTPTVTVSPTATVVPTLTPEPTASATPTPTPTSTIIPTIVPTMTPTPPVTPTVSVTPTSTPSPTVIPTQTPVPSVTPSPTVVPEVLPSFSVFRQKQCTAQLLSSTNQVQTDKLTQIQLLRGIWNIDSLDQIEGILSAHLHLVRQYDFNLMFGYNSFFRSPRITNRNEKTVISGSSMSEILQKASVSWCQR